MKLSGFTLLGLLKNKGGPSSAETFFVQAKSLLASDRAKRALSLVQGSFADCLAYAVAPMAAYAYERLARADEQRFAGGVYDMLPQQEEEHGIVPDPAASVVDRKRAYAARLLIPQGSRRPALEDALRTLLGANYVGIHVTRPTEALLFPDALGDPPMLLQPLNAIRKLIRVIPWISVGLGAEQTVTYEPVEPLPTSDGVPVLKVGDRLLIEPEIQGRAEPVTVLSSAPPLFPGAPPSFSAVFVNAHEAMAWGSTLNYPAWSSTQRELVIVAKSAAAVSPVLRQQVHELLERMVPGVTTWAVVQEVGPSAAGPFTTDDPVLGMLDANPLEALTVP